MTGPATIADAPTVTVRLCGGLGNQLFQYAFGRALALRSGAGLRLDASAGFIGDPYGRKCELGDFCHAGERIIAPSGSGLGTFLRRFRDIADRMRAPAARRTLREPEAIPGSLVAPFAPWAVSLRVSKDVTSAGYWQSDRYFLDADETIRRDLAMRFTPTPRDAELSDEIAASGSSIGVHVRRHRVMTAREDLQVPLHFYHAAIARIRESDPGARIFLFSDDHDWARDKFKDEGALVRVEHNGNDRPVADFWLLKQCRHFVLSNSTFSWWSAWLGAQQDKKVVIPKSFYCREYMAPASWERL
jgi:Glycosyl transferase family 11